MAFAVVVYALVGAVALLPDRVEAQTSREALFGDDKPAAGKSKPSDPTSRDSLFGVEKPAPTAPEPGSRDALFGDEKPAAKSPDAAPSRDALFGDAEPPKTKPAATTGWRGYVQTDLAYTYSSPEHWSKARARVELTRQGRLSDTVRFRVSGRAEYDAAYDIESAYYAADVRRDQRRDFQLRETYLDVTAGDWELRLGRQHIVWGEVPGLFFADVVSAKDLREFYLSELDGLRNPQWAVRAEHFSAGAHFEIVWVPWVTVDRVGKPEADFHPFPRVLRTGAVFQGEEKPSRTLSNSNLGVRLSTLKEGWDLSAFVYRAIDGEASFYREPILAAPAPGFLYKPRHDRITQVGGTVTKDLGAFVLKAEGIYTRNKGFSVLRPTHPDGVARLDVFDFLLGADFTLGADTRLYAYAFQRRMLDYDRDIIPDRTETGVTLQLSHKISSEWELQALFITSLNRTDWMFRPKVTWNFAKNWRMNVGLDALHGPPLGFFGRFADRDRIYADVRYSF